MPVCPPLPVRNYSGICNVFVRFLLGGRVSVVIMKEYVSKMMQLFTDWARLKMKLHNKKTEENEYYYAGEIWWASLGQNIGDEQNGKNRNFERPIIIIKAFSARMLLVVPVSSKVKVNRYRILAQIRGKSCIANISQMRTISSKRLIRQMGTVSKQDLNAIQRALIHIF